MIRHGLSDTHRGFASVICGTVCVVGLLGCQAGPGSPDPGATGSIIDYQQRVLAREASDPGAPAPIAISPASPRTILASAQDSQDQRESLLTGPTTTSQPAPDAVLAEIPDPSVAEQFFAERLEGIRRTAPEERVVRSYERAVARAKEYLAQLDMPEQIELSLDDCLRRAMLNNYTVRSAAYGPAISRTQLIEAEAAFDAVFFLDYTFDNVDQPTASQLAGGQIDSRNYQGGFRQLLPTGLRAQTSIGQTRVKTDNQFQTINPSYSSVFTASLTQPLLRGFGLDVNRAQMEIARRDLSISKATFVQQVRDTLLSVEQAYWALLSVRRNVMIQAEAVAQVWVTWQNMYQRREQDATPVEISNSRARWQSRYVQFIEAVKNVRDAEDRLKNLLNDPDLLLSGNVEIVTVHTPFALPIVLDHFAEVRTALEQRSEIAQARERIDQSRIQTAVNKNALLPQLDLVFNYRVQGLDGNADSSFDNLTTNRFRSYSVTVNFSVPIGNRAPRAAWRRARMQESQAIIALKQASDAVVEEVNSAVRRMSFRYRQLPPQFDSVVQSNRNLRSLQARAQRVDPSFLETELSAVEQLANNRSVLLQVIVDYNIAIAELEKAKGTLLEYNNVTISDADSD